MPGPSFRFRLERVRALREREEDTAKQALAGAIHARLHSARALEAAAQRVVEAREAQLEIVTAPATAAELLGRQAYLERSERAHRASQEDLGRRDQQLAARREELGRAARDRHTLERLKERRRADHERELARVEAISLDEMAVSGYRRGRI
jgi:flagellar FliJ protein